MRLAPDVIDVLERSTTEGSALYLPDQLDRKLYVKVNTALQALGAEWNRKAKAHLFPSSDAAALLAPMLTAGEVTTAKDIEYFPTPPAVVARLLLLAELTPGMEVLEPSAGQGAIARPVADSGCAVDCIEIDGANVNALRELGCARAILTGDFLTVPPDRIYDRVIMNPPFGNQADIRHVLHALTFLKPGGWLLSVMAAGVTFRQDRLASTMRATIDTHDGRVIPLPDGSFKESGTGVGTVIVVLRRFVR